jgi:hypothetical protein
LVYGSWASSKNRKNNGFFYSDIYKIIFSDAMLPYAVKLYYLAQMGHIFPGQYYVIAFVGHEFSEM